MSRSIEDLHPALSPLCRRHIEMCAKIGIGVYVTQTLREKAVQEALWMKGRDASGNIVVPSQVVTHARPGWSWHEYGLAYDLALQTPEGTITWNDIDMNHDLVLDWMQVGIEGEKLGLTWGGRWKKLRDMPHFELTDGLSIGVVARAGMLPPGWPKGATA